MDVINTDVTLACMYVDKLSPVNDRAVSTSKIRATFSNKMLS